LGLQLFPAVPLALLIHAFPESPRWLAMKGRHDDALETLARLHANGNTSDIFVQTGTCALNSPLHAGLTNQLQSWLISRLVLRRRGRKARTRASISYSTFAAKVDISTLVGACCSLNLATAGAFFWVLSFNLASR
jgi:hypothetical protein